MGSSAQTESNNNIGYRDFNETKKRAFDLCVGATGGLLTGVFIALPAAIALKIESPNKPVIFKQIRQGKDNKPFTLYKLRTLDDEGNPTKVGAFLRDHSLDEVLQLWNVVKGDMSMVGYRPRIYNDLETLPSDSIILRHKPALTGLFQTAYGKGLVPAIDNEQDREVIKRIYEESEALEDVSIISDLKCCFNTFSIVIFGKKDRSLARKQKSLHNNAEIVVENDTDTSCAVVANDSFGQSAEPQALSNMGQQAIAQSQAGYFDPSILNNEEEQKPPKPQSL